MRGTQRLAVCALMGVLPAMVVLAAPAAGAATRSSVAGTGSCPTGQVMPNSGFEDGTSYPWSTTSGVIQANGPQETAHSGTYFAWLDGYGTSHTDTLSTTLTLPTGCTSYVFAYWLHIDTAETSTTTAYDKLTLKVNSFTVATYSNLTPIAGYVQKSMNLSAYAGTTLTIKFTGVEDSSRQTSFCIDDTTFTLS